MINTYISIDKLSTTKKDILYSILFGILSIVFAKIEFSIPGFDGRVSNFREVPLLIAILYIRNPIYLVVLSLITAIYTSSFNKFVRSEDLIQLFNKKCYRHYS